MSKSLHDGRYTASISIRTGHGSTTHDRVMRFVPLFDTAHAAIRYATDQGLAWVVGRGVPSSIPV